MEDPHTELEHLLTQALEADDVKQMDELYHMVVDKSNALRSRYGIPSQAIEQDPVLVLKTPTQQMQAAGVCKDMVMGKAVYGFATADAAKVNRNLFRECFNKEEHAQRYKIMACNETKKYMPDKVVKILPPVLLRSRSNAVVAFHASESGKVSVGPKPAERNILLVMFDDGPIIPVIQKDALGRAEQFIKMIYTLQGVTDAKRLGTVMSD